MTTIDADVDINQKHSSTTTEDYHNDHYRTVNNTEFLSLLKRNIVLYLLIQLMSELYWSVASLREHTFTSWLRDFLAQN